VSHLEILQSELQTFELELPSLQTAALARYCDELTHWNAKVNLTGLRGSEMVRRLVVEPAWIARQLNMAGVLLDIGSGNGSPAIPLHILSRFTQVHLIEARAKRAAFLRQVTAVLQLRDAIVYNSRFEDIAAQIGAVDWVTLQAVALTKDLMQVIPASMVAWITSARAVPPINPTSRIRVPVTGTEVLLFRLDHS
jgi:16S rRNA (guanine527-N7)-methyltransferase